MTTPDKNYEIRMADAIYQVIREIDLIGWYSATENAAIDYKVSLPELQRAIDFGEWNDHRN